MAERKVFRSETTQKTLMEAAEKLFANQGIANVSVNDILIEAGQKNQSAVKYHFGSKHELLERVLLEHAKSLDERRGRLLADLPEQPDLNSLLEAFLHPLVDEVASGDVGRYFAAYLAQTHAEPGFDLLNRLPARHSASLIKCLQLLDPFIGQGYIRNWLYDISAFGLHRWASQSNAPGDPDDLKRSLVAVSAALIGAATARA